MTLARWRLDGKSALVTGGSKGIGRAVVDQLVALGARVCDSSTAAVDDHARRSLAHRAARPGSRPASA